MSSSLFSAADPEVNAVLQELLSNVQAILGERFIGLYLYGSLATGDFDRASDIDFVVVSDGEVRGETLTALQVMHRQLAILDTRWAQELDGSYISQQALRRYDPRHAQHPHLDRGSDELSVSHHHFDWVIQRYSLRKHGIALAGPALKTLIEPVSAAEVQQALLMLLYQWWEPMISDPSRLWRPGYQAYAVLTMCRIHYTMEHGTLPSKAVAARWAMEALEEPWRGPIERALVQRLRAGETTAEEVHATQQFIRFTVTRSRALEQGNSSKTGTL